MRAAVREAASRPELRIPLMMMVLVGTLAYNFQVLLPLFARFTWEGTAATYGILTAAMGVGSVTGALVSGARNRVTPGLIVGSAVLFGVAQLIAAFAPTLEIQLLALVPLGAASVTFAAGVNSSLQLNSGAPARADHGAVLGRLRGLDADRRAARWAGSPRSPARARAWPWAAPPRSWPRRGGGSPTPARASTVEAGAARTAAAPEPRPPRREPEPEPARLTARCPTGQTRLSAS